MRSFDVPTLGISNEERFSEMKSFVFRFLTYVYCIAVKDGFQHVFTCIFAHIQRLY